MSRGNNNNNYKKTKGKQKIEIKYIEIEEDRMVTFSKRKAGIFKKASELATLTGVDIAIVINSPKMKDRPFSFGHPSTDSVIKHFLAKKEAKDMTDLILEAKRMSNINALSEQLDNTMMKVDEQKEKGKKLKEKNDTEGSEEVEFWWNTPVEQLDQEGLIRTKNSYEQILVEIFSKFQEKTRINSGASSSSDCSNTTPLHVPPESVPQFPTPPGYE